MPVQFRDYYQTLGVSKTATQDEIKSAFRKLARKYHPDTAQDKKSAEEKFKEINEAFEVLSDPEKRKKYDEYGANWQQGGFGPPPSGSYPRQGFGGSSDGGGTEFHFGGTGFSDFFEQLFGARRGRGHGFPGYEFEEMPMRGQDVEADILVTLEEALHGSTRQISFRRGAGSQLQTYTVKIPKGVREGQRIRLAGLGESGGGKEQAGDLYLRVKFEKHPEFEAEGSDLYYDLEIPAWQAVLGGDVEIPTLDGRAKLHVPAGSQNSQKFRLSGRGLPRKEGGRGNFYAVLRAILPREITSREQELWKQLASLEETRS
ncbi:MAG TPA: J domain-containing protein [Terrimicrobiaceae bacterium]